MTKPTVLFFARGYQADFYPILASDRYEAVFVTMTRAESALVEKRGQKVAACFEEAFPSLVPAPVPADYLLSSPMSDRFLGRFDTAERRTILGKEIAFWADLLDRLRPAAVANELIAIEMSEVLLIECRKRQVPYLAGMNCVVEDLFYWLPDPMTISGKKLALPRPGPDSFALADAYLSELSAKDYAPFYVRNLSGRRALLPLAAAIVKGTVWWLRGLAQKAGGAFRYESYGEEYGKKVAVFAKSFTHRYDRLEDIPADREIVFFPLHQEPEATLNYMSAFYANQVATIENILKCLTPEQVLVVKEHPVDKGSLLRRKFWAIRKEFSNLYYLPAEVHGRQVLERAERVVTLTSTVGWEAAILGKQVMVLGEIFYDNLDGIAAPRDWAELRAILRRPASEGQRLSREAAREFVAAMAEMSYRGNPFPHGELYSERNRELVIAAICDAAGIAA